eukprot:349773-Chlamydomonas_euryale.AAC.4
MSLPTHACVHAAADACVRACRCRRMRACMPLPTHACVHAAADACVRACRCRRMRACVHAAAVRLEEEHMRLVHVTAGSEGLNPTEWPGLLNKVKVLAERQLKRQNALALQEWVDQGRAAAGVAVAVVLIVMVGRLVCVCCRKQCAQPADKTWWAGAGVLAGLFVDWLDIWPTWWLGLLAGLLAGSLATWLAARLAG